MRYHLSDDKQAEAAFTYLDKLTGKHALVEVKEIRPGRTLPQNSFFYLLTSYFGLQVGFTPDESKTYIKRHMADVFAYEKNGEKFLRSTADLNKDEMSKVIDRMYRLAADMSI